MSQLPPALLCFDGSADAVAAVAAAGRLLGTRRATVITVWEPPGAWSPLDPGALISGGVSRLAADELGLDEIAERLAQVTLERGVVLAGQAGFAATGILAGGHPWRAICEAAAELEAEPIVVGARGLSRVQSVVLGSVSAAVAAHAQCAVLTIPAAHHR